MKTTFPKRSQSHKDTIEEISKVIQTVGKKKIAYIILFGSFARGDFYETELKQESDGSWLEYISDYDFLVVINRHEHGSGEPGRNLERKINEKISKELLDNERPVSIIIEPLTRVDNYLKKGHYFFADIKKEGILLFKDEKAKELKEAKELTNQERRQLAKGYYDEWIERAEDFFISYKTLFEEKRYKISAFQLHQATESLYQCCHLVFTNYRPRIHDIEKLNKPLIQYCQEFANIFPKSTKEETESFDLLKRAYVEARYSKDYSITKEQLEYLIKRVKKLKDLVERVCKEKIQSLII